MSEIPFIDDAYIDEIIKSAEAYNPALNKTQGVKLRELMKRLRDRIEQNNTGIVRTTGDQNISGAKTFNQIAAEELSFLKNGYVNVLKNPSDQNQNYVYTLPKGSGELALKGNLTKTDLGLGNVDNTSDADKPVSLATRSTLDLKENLSNKTDDPSLGHSKILYPTQRAVKDYVDFNFVDKINAQTIGGVKTFTSTPISKTRYEANNGITKAEYSSGNMVFARDGYTMAINPPGPFTINRIIDLPDANGTIALTSDIPNPSLYQLRSEKGISNGYASLDANGKIPNSQVPALAISETFVVASQSAMLAIVGADKGDVAVRTDISKSFILTASPASTLSNWQELLTPKDPIEPIKNQGSVIQDANIRIGGVISVEDSITNNKGRLSPSTLIVSSGLNAGLVDSSSVTVIANNTTFCSLRHNSIVIGKQSGHSINILPDYSGLKNPVETINLTLPKTSGILTTRSEFLSGQTIEANTTGNAATATNAMRWGGVLGNLSVPAIAPHNFAVNDLRTGLWASAVPSQIKTLLGIPLDGETLETVMARNNITSPTMFLKNEAGDNILQISSGDGLNGSTTIEAKKLIGSIGNTIRLNPYYGGNVSIGANTATAKLDIKGGAGQNTLRLSKPSNNAPSLEFVGESASTILEAGNDYQVYTNGVVRQSILRSGATTFTGNVSSSPAPTDVNHLTNKTYVDALVSGKANLINGNTFSGLQTFEGDRPIVVVAPPAFPGRPFTEVSYSGIYCFKDVQKNYGTQLTYASLEFKRPDAGQFSLSGPTTGFAGNKSVFLPATNGVLIAINDVNTSSPASSTSTGTKGEVRYSSTHIYVCTGTDTWVRSVIETAW